VKALAWILTAATILIGADVFLMSSTESDASDDTRIEQGPTTLAGGMGCPTPPPDAY
jgi:hypothetical protein